MYILIMQFLITVLIPAFIEFLHIPYLFSDYKLACIHLLKKSLRINDTVLSIIGLFCLICPVKLVNFPVKLVNTVIHNCYKICICKQRNGYRKNFRNMSIVMNYRCCTCSMASMFLSMTLRTSSLSSFLGHCSMNRF